MTESMFTMINQALEMLEEDEKERPEVFRKMDDILSTDRILNMLNDDGML